MDTKDEERAVRLAMEITGRAGLSKEKHVEPILALIDEIRTEAADRALRWVHGFGVELLHYDDKGNDLDPDPALHAAITGKEIL